MDIDYALCVDLLGLNANQFKLSNSAPPHEITDWSGPDSQPTEEEFQEAWDKYEADQLASQYQRDRQYPTIGDQLDMQYHDQLDGTTTWKDAVAKVKADNPKPE